MLCACFVFSLFFEVRWYSMRAPSDLVQISGVPEATQISKIVTDANGIVVSDTQKPTAPVHSVQVMVQGPDKTTVPLETTVVYGGVSRGMTIAGRGVGAFSDVHIQYGDEEQNTKADWAGQFNVENVSASELSYDEPVRIALQGYNIAHDGVDETDLKIEIFDAPLGGGPEKDPNTNEYSNDFCGTPPLSVCVRQRMDRQIEMIVENYIEAFYRMGEQLTAVQAYYVGAIGFFFDAKMQLETQRLHQQLVAEAHKDYHPGDQMCRFGSFVRSVAQTESKVAHAQQAVNKALMESYTGAEFSSTAEGYAVDVETRLRQFREVYCDVADNNHGLQFMCQHDQTDTQISRNEGVGADEASRVNNDIDFSRLVEWPLTLDVNFLDSNKTDEEEDILALARNLYWFKPLPHGDKFGIEDDYPRYLRARRLMAMQNVAHNSFANLIAQKSRSVTDDNDGPAFMKSMLREFGLSDNDIHDLLGDYPSYHAQMDVLTKKIYQDPDFYTNLYDKPVNIKRMGVTMDAIKLMQMRDMHNASLRREMLVSLMLEQGLEEPATTASTVLGAQIATRGLFGIFP